MTDFKKCISCGEQIPGNAVFCPYCGKKQEAVCANCGTVLPGGAKFCHICGTPVAAKEAGKSADRKPDVDSSKKNDKGNAPDQAKEFSPELLSDCIYPKEYYFHDGYKIWGFPSSSYIAVNRDWVLYKPDGPKEKEWRFELKQIGSEKSSKEIVLSGAGKDFTLLGFNSAGIWLYNWEDDTCTGQNRRHELYRYNFDGSEQGCWYFKADGSFETEFTYICEDTAYCLIRGDKDEAVYMKKVGGVAARAVKTSAVAPRYGISEFCADSRYLYYKISRDMGDREEVQSEWYQWDSVSRRTRKLDQDGTHIMKIFPGKGTMWVSNKDVWQERKIGTDIPGRSLDFSGIDSYHVWFDGEEFFSWDFREFPTLSRYSFSETDGGAMQKTTIQLGRHRKSRLFLPCGDYFIYDEWDRDGSKTFYVPKNFEDDAEDNDKVFQLSSQIKELLPYGAY